jgi:pSer/pThr/pTyr-binding forkhead associated (FHA) protein
MRDVVDLLVLIGAGSGACFQLPEIPAIVGRSPEAHLRLQDPWISNLHALFEPRGEELWVVDLESRNGTFVNGQRVREALVGPGTLVAFGETEVRLVAPVQAGRTREFPAAPVRCEAVAMTGRHELYRAALARPAKDTAAD